MSRRSCKIDAGGEEVEVKYTELTRFEAEVVYDDSSTDEGVLKRWSVDLDVLDAPRADKRRDIKKEHIQAAVDTAEYHADDGFELDSVKVKEVNTVRRYWRGSETDN